MVVVGGVVVPVGQLGHPVGQSDPRRGRPIPAAPGDLVEGALDVLRDAPEEVHRELVDVLHGPPLRRLLLLRAIPRNMPGLAAAMAEAILERHPRASARGGKVAAAAVAALDVAGAAASRASKLARVAIALAALALAFALAVADIDGHHRVVHRVLVGLALVPAVLVVVVFVVVDVGLLEGVDVDGLALEEEHILGDLLNVLGELVEVYLARSRVPHKLLAEVLGQGLKEVFFHFSRTWDVPTRCSVVIHNLLEADDAEQNFFEGLNGGRIPDEMSKPALMHVLALLDVLHDSSPCVKSI